MSRGGRRAGTPGKNYGQRSDLNQVRQPSGPPSPPPPNLSPGPAQPAQPQVQGAPAAGPPIPQPGTLGSLGPTLRPNEPITHGLSTGPGAGPEIFQQFQPDPMASALAQISATIPASSTTPQLAALKAALAASVNNANNPSMAMNQ